MNNRLRLAPMMGYTTAPFRLLIHLIAPKVQLYTEMVSVNALIHHPQGHYFNRFAQENNTAFQLGGDDPKNSTEVAKRAEQAGFSEININCGCPSNRVQNANFGACLMQQPERVAHIIQTINTAVTIPVSVKHRIGIDKNTDYEFLHHFVKTIVEAGCQHIIVHARNAWLSGLSPRLNRKVPPLKPQFVYQLKHDFPSINICINGEINSPEKITQALSPSPEHNNITLDGVMIGRSAWDNPYLFAHIEQNIAQDSEKNRANSHLPYPLPSPINLLEQYFHFLQEIALPTNTKYPTQALIRPLTHLFYGMNGAKIWRRAVTSTHHNLKQAETTLRQLAKSIISP